VNREPGVSVTRETIIYFSAPLSSDTTLDQDMFYAEFGGRKILSRAELSSDGMKATLFYLEPLPGSAQVVVTFDGSAVKDDTGAFVDADGDGIPGGQAVIAFNTLSLSPLPGTGVTGQVFASELAPATDGGVPVDKPLAGVTITVDGLEETHRTVTDATGSFSLSPVPPGRFFVHIDGRTVIDEAAGIRYPDNAYYPFVGILKPLRIKSEQLNYLSTNHIFALNLRSRLMEHIALCVPEEDKAKKHEISTLKKLDKKTLRMRQPKGVKVVHVYDPAIVDYRYWLELKRTGIYIVTVEKEKSAFWRTAILEFDRNDPRNLGVISDEYVVTSNEVMIRRIVYEDPVTVRIYKFITTITDKTVPPGAIAFMYKSRWDIEKAFDQTKNRFMERKSWGKSETSKQQQARLSTPLRIKSEQLNFRSTTPPNQMETRPSRRREPAPISTDALRNTRKSDSGTKPLPIGAIPRWDNGQSKRIAGTGSIPSRQTKNPYSTQTRACFEISILQQIGGHNSVIFAKSTNASHLTRPKVPIKPWGPTN
jgi:hypothetical protein